MAPSSYYDPPLLLGSLGFKKMSSVKTLSFSATPLPASRDMSLT